MIALEDAKGDQLIFILYLRNRNNACFYVLGSNNSIFDLAELNS